jgi:hypothetical protein
LFTIIFAETTAWSAYPSVKDAWVTPKTSSPLMKRSHIRVNLDENAGNFGAQRQRQRQWQSARAHSYQGIPVANSCGVYTNENFLVFWLWYVDPLKGDNVWRTKKMDSRSCHRPRVLWRWLLRIHLVSLADQSIWPDDRSDADASLWAGLEPARSLSGQLPEAEEEAWSTGNPARSYADETRHGRPDRIYVERVHEKTSLSRGDEPIQKSITSRFRFGAEITSP